MEIEKKEMEARIFIISYECINSKFAVEVAYLWDRLDINSHIFNNNNNALCILNPA